MSLKRNLEGLKNFSLMNEKFLSSNWTESVQKYLANGWWFLIMISADYGLKKVLKIINFEVVHERNEEIRW